jgi:hypothetical protein
MPSVKGILLQKLVYHLIELYFASAFPTHMHPVCHHIHCYILRKASILREDAPRHCNPALLASMLWVAASDNRALSLPLLSHYQKKICRFLCALSTRLLRSLVHISPEDWETLLVAASATDIISGGRIHEDLSTLPPYPIEGAGSVGWCHLRLVGTLDDVITHIHITSIISSSEQKAASMQWLVQLPRPFCLSHVNLAKSD